MRHVGGWVDTRRLARAARSGFITAGLVLGALGIAHAQPAGPDLTIGKTHVGNFFANQTDATYTLQVSNTGGAPSVGMVTVTDTLPASLSPASAVGTGWTCSISGSTVTCSRADALAFGASYPPITLMAVVSPTPPAAITNTATVAGGGDTNTTNNTALDTANVGFAFADLAITKTDGVTSVAAGGSVTYTIVASNAGPSSATGAIVADTLPAMLSGATWTCVGAGGGTCTASSSGNINDTVNLPAGGSVTYTVSAAISATATGTLVNTATVVAPASVTDPNPANNSATDTDTITQGGDLALTLTGTVGPIAPGSAVAYTLTATNAGPASASGVAIASVFPAPLTGVQWTCVATSGASCAASGSNAVADTVVLPAGDSVVYSVSATVAANASVASVTSSASLTPPAGFADASAANNTASTVTGIQLAPVAVPTLTPWGLAVLALGVVGALGLGRRPERG